MFNTVVLDVGNANTGSLNTGSYNMGDLTVVHRHVQHGNANTGFQRRKYQYLCLLILAMNNGLFNTGDRNNGVLLLGAGSLQFSITTPD